MEDTSKKQENIANNEENSEQTNNFESQSNTDYLNTLKEVLFKKKIINLNKKKQNINSGIHNQYQKLKVMSLVI